ncbi:ATP11 protein-domain-containing protein [Kickxella alabastrina]|uniref:ATP11 protein-domain-containing protein n=1 Tax=Kickxella alabastrina TaxID=61397 RepID=UPI00221F9FE0|nr:ATP11 protein-domain-containing protein [Kickxella alabastrina]KAI7824461.1 ATP11 protein-domain-containing protein [Kickxella alabastrina]
MSHVPNFEDKYKAKLLQKAKAEGVATIEELKKKKREEIATKKEDQHQRVETATAPTNGTQGRRSAASPKKSPSNLPPSTKTLDQIMRIELLENNTAEEISDIWNKYHATRDTISAVIPTSTYTDLLQVARKNPIFIIPLPRKEGVEFYFLQFEHHQVHFTSLIEYKTNTVNARPYLTLTHYTDLMQGKGVVLMRGEMDGEQRFLDVQNAQYLALQMQQFYVTGGLEKRALLEKFNQRPEEFDYQELMSVAEKL